MTNPPPVLVILGTRADPHVERVERELMRRHAARVLVLDYLDDTRFTLEADAAGRARLRINGAPVPDPLLIWDRVKILPGSELYLRGGGPSRAYAALEWRALYKLVCGLHGGRVVNSLEARACMLKPYQQLIAAHAGFRVPPSLVSNDKPSVQAFHRAHDQRVIMKSLSSDRVPAVGEDGEDRPYSVMTMRVSAEDLAAAAPDELAYCPHFFQREIAKSHELRVVVVDTELIALRVESQGHALTELDWRKGLEIARFMPVALDDATIGKIRGFMRGMGLFTGSLDLIVDRDGETWFLECNQNGAWGWLDDAVHGAITRLFADGFARRLRQLAELERELS